MQGKWKIRKSQDIFKSGLFRMRQDEVELPDGRIMPRYYVIEFPAWIHVVALTAKNQLIMLRQYRHAAEDWFLEIPGGSTDGHKVEDPLAAAKRELIEETGYVSDDWTALGEHFPNPALQNNATYTFLAKNCRYDRAPQLDPFEILEVEFKDVAEVYQKLESGELKHSLMVASLALARPHLAKLLR